MATLTNKRHVGLHDLHVIDSFLIIIRLRWPWFQMWIKELSFFSTDSDISQKYIPSTTI